MIRKIINRLVSVVAIVMLVMISVANPALAAENKVSPTGDNDPAVAWANEPLAYDDDVGTGADLTTAAAVNSWSEWIELTHDKLDTYAIRVYALSAYLCLIHWRLSCHCQ